MKLFMCKLTQDFFTRKVVFLVHLLWATNLLTRTRCKPPSHGKESAEHVTLKWLTVDYRFHMLIRFRFLSTNT